MKVLFLCNQNQHRSKTAEEIFKDRFETKSAGLFNLNPVSEGDLSWADIIVVMEDFQREEVARRFPKQCLRKRVISLNIKDSYYYRQPELINIIELKMKELFEPFIE